MIGPTVDLVFIELSFFRLFLSLFSCISQYGVYLFLSLFKPVIVRMRISIFSLFLWPSKQSRWKYQEDLQHLFSPRRCSHSSLALVRHSIIASISYFFFFFFFRCVYRQVCVIFYTLAQWMCTQAHFSQSSMHRQNETGLLRSLVVRWQLKSLDFDSSRVAARGILSQNQRVRVCLFIYLCEILFWYDFFPLSLSLCAFFSLDVFDELKILIPKRN